MYIPPRKEERRDFNAYFLRVGGILHLVVGISSLPFFQE
jgi:hypothetical protein